MASQSIDGDEMYLENEFRRLSHFMKQKLAMYQRETQVSKVLRSEIVDLKRQLRKKMAKCNRCCKLALENKVLKRKCINYERQMAKLAENQRKEVPVSNPSNEDTRVTVVRSEPGGSLTSIGLNDLTAGFPGAGHEKPMDLQVMPENQKPTTSGAAEGRNDQLSRVDDDVEDDESDSDSDSESDSDSDDEIVKPDVMMCKWRFVEKPAVARKSTGCTMIRCGKLFKSRSKLAVHINKHIAEDPSLFFCCEWEDCETFPGSYEHKSMMDHVRQHTGVKNYYVCPRGICQKVFLTSSDLQKHVCGKTAFTCPFSGCPNLYRSKGNRDFHHENFHRSRDTNHKPDPAHAYLCTFVACGQTFDQRADFESHLRTASHESTGPFAKKRRKIIIKHCRPTA